MYRHQFLHNAGFYASVCFLPGFVRVFLALSLFTPVCHVCLFQHLDVFVRMVPYGTASVYVCLPANKFRIPKVLYIKMELKQFKITVIVICFKSSEAASYSSSSFNAYSYDLFGTYPYFSTSQWNGLSGFSQLSIAVARKSD